MEPLKRSASPQFDKPPKKQCAVKATEDGNRHDKHHVKEDSQQVCFGSICEVQVRFFQRDLRLLRSKLDSIKPDISKLTIVEQGALYTIAYSGTIIGQIQPNVSKAMRSLAGIGAIKTTIEADQTTFEQCINMLKTQAKPSKNWAIEINLHGNRGDKERIGKSLAESRIYLDRPRSMCDGVPYENPHMISFPGMTIESKDILLDNSLTLKSNTSSRQRAFNSPDLLLKGLDHREHLGTISIDVRITTPLIDHQHLGVNFILQRESAIQPQPSFSLWSQPSAESTRHFHKVTNRSSTNPEEFYGGIIADEMGLGKSLTMLSAVVMTQALSKKFAESPRLSSGRQRKKNSRATLIIVPSALLLENWINESTIHFAPSTFRIHKYHGHNKETDAQKLIDHDIVLTTYGTLTSEFSGKKRLLCEIAWFRIILDEAHIIRNPRAKVFSAAAALSARSRWCLSGTPIQNRLEDLGSLVRFLQIPFLKSPAEFRTYCIRPFERRGSEGFENIRKLLTVCCLRRTQHLLKLPEPSVIEHKLAFSEQEKKKYSKINEAYRKALDDALCGRTNSTETFGSILQPLQSLRLLCNHGLAGDDRILTNNENEKDVLALLQDGPVACVRCGADVFADDVASENNFRVCPAKRHITCDACIDSENINQKCAPCLVSLKNQATNPISSPGPSFRQSKNNMATSTKLAKIVDDIKEHKEKEKCIIFSAWKNTLLLLGRQLSANGLPFVQLDGSMSLPERQIALDAFHKNSKTSLLMTLGTGAVGLNLTIATRIHIVEPQWNPTIELQAVGRAVRLGQTKKVSIVRYIMRNSIEESIQSIQVEKKQLARLGFGSNKNDTNEGRKKRLKEMRAMID